MGDTKNNILSKRQSSSTEDDSSFENIADKKQFVDNEGTSKSCMKKEAQKFENKIFSFQKKINDRQINWSEHDLKIEIPGKQSIYSKYLVHGIKPLIKYQQAYQLYEGSLRMADSGEQTTMNVCLNSYHERSDIKMLPKLFQKTVQGESNSINYFIKKPITSEFKREINSMKQMQMCSYQRYFCGWVESQKKEKQDEVNKIAEKLYNQKQYFEYSKEGLYTIRLIHCENIFEEFQEIIIDHVNYKIITQMCYIITLPSEYYQQFAIVQECL